MEIAYSQVTVRSQSGLSQVYSQVYSQVWIYHRGINLCAPTDKESISCIRICLFEGIRFITISDS